MIRREKGRYDYTLLAALCLIIIMGLVILYSTSAYNGEVKFHDAFYYLKKQAFATSLGIACMFFVAGMDYHMWEHVAVLGYVISLLLSLAVMFVGEEYNGSKRWLSLGPFSFQPSEFAKVAVVLFLAVVITKNSKNMGKIKTLVIVMLSILPIVGLVGASNLSTAIIILGIGVVLVFIASPKYGQFILMGLLGAAFMTVFLALESYRLERLEIWRNPEAFEKGYQTIQGLYAIGSGGLFGRGLGQSVQKLGFVPEAQNDMIFSIVCEELGLVGALTVVLLFTLLVIRGFYIAMRAKDKFGMLMAIGLTSHIGLQAFFNIAVVSNLIPNTGISLPFFSYGGTALILQLAEMGIVLNISRVRYQSPQRTPAAERAPQAEVQLQGGNA